MLFLYSGKIFSLMMASKLGDYIVGTAVETIETEKLIKEFENVIVDDVYGAGTSIDKVTSDLQEKLDQKGFKINSIAVDNIYNETPVTKANTNIWYSAKNISDATKHIVPVRVLFSIFFYSFLIFLVLNPFRIVSHLCLECKENMLPRRECQVLRSDRRLLVRNRHNASSCQALQESQFSHRKEWFPAGLKGNQFLVRPTTHSTRSDTYEPLCTCICISLCTNCVFFGYH